MIALVERVRQASVEVAGAVAGAIGPGLLLVRQLTLAVDASTGNRPKFTGAAAAAPDGAH